MNLDPKNEIQRKIFVYTVSLILAVAFYLLFSRIDTLLALAADTFSILLPFILGFGIAFVLNPAIQWLEKKISGFGLKESQKRLISCAVVFIIFIFLMGFTLWILIPALLDSIDVFAQNIPEYSRNLENYLIEYAARFNINYAQVESYFSNLDLLAPVSSFLQNSISRIFSYSYSFISVLFKIIIGLAAAFYLSIDKERLVRILKMLIYSVLSRQNADFLISYGHKAKLVFEKYIVGNILDSTIVGLVCWLVCMIVGVPYSPMIGLFIGITNLIPVFGPFLGAIPVIIILLLIRPFYALFFMIFILILQQIDGNILKPIILGDKLGLSGFWILFAVTIGGSLFGIIGMFLGVPVFALIYEAIRDITELRLKQRAIHFESRGRKK